MSASAKKKRSPHSSSFLGLAQRRRGDDGSWRLFFNWKRIAGLVALLVVVGYLSLFSLLFVYFKYYRGYDDASYFSTLVIPFHWDNYQKQRGEYEIKLGMEALKENEYGKAMHLLGTGIIRSPRNLEGRVALARLYELGMKRPDISAKLLDPQLEYAVEQNEPLYINYYFKLLSDQGMDESTIEESRRLLTAAPEGELRQRLLLYNVNALIYRGQFDDALDVIEEENLDSIEVGVTQKSRIYWQLGRVEEAISMLENAIDQFDNNNMIYAELVRYTREMGMLEKARQYCIQRGIEFPLAPGPRIDLLYLLDDTDSELSIQREIAALLKQFSRSEKAHRLLAMFAERSGRLDLARKIYSRAIEQGFDPVFFTLSLVEAQIQAVAFGEAIQTLDDIQATEANWLDNEKGRISMLKSLAYYGRGQIDLSDVHLEDYLKTRNRSSTQIIENALAFKKLGGLRQAQQILQHGYENNLNNQAVLTELVRLNLQLGNASQLAVQLVKLLEMRRPPTDLLEEARVALNRDRFLFMPNQRELIDRLNTLLAKVEG